MTGRIDLIEIYPFMIAESHGRKPPEWISILTSSKSSSLEVRLEAWSKKVWASEPMLKQLVEKGGLPGICFKRDATVRSKQFSNHLDTLFGRDIHLISETRVSIVRLRELFGVLCANQGEPVNYTNPFACDLNPSNTY